MKKALETALAKMGGAVRPLSELPPVTFLPGGIPHGRVVEIYGDPDSGKTTLALQIARSVDNALYIDADHGLAPEHCRGLYLGKPDTLEDALTMVEIAAPAMDVIVVDTLDALPTRSELERTIGTYSQHDHTKLLSKAISRLLGPLAKSGCTLVLVCQTRVDPSVMYGNPIHSTGGRALRSFATLRIYTQAYAGHRFTRITKQKYSASPSSGFPLPAA